MAEERKRVLVVGGSGYLGQHLLAALASSGGDVDVAFTHRRDAAPRQLLDALPGVRAFRADLRSGDGLEAVAASFGQVLVERSRKLSSSTCAAGELSSISPRRPSQPEWPC